MTGRLDRTSVAATLFVALGTFMVLNGVIGIAGADWYQAVVLDVMERSLGSQSPAVLEPSLTSPFMRLGWMLSLVEGVLNWLTAAALLVRGRSWGRVAGLVIGAVGLFGGAYDLLVFLMLSQWTAPLPAFAWLDRDVAVLSSVAATALVAAGYVAILVLLGRQSTSLREATSVIAR